MLSNQADSNQLRLLLLLELLGDSFTEGGPFLLQENGSRLLQENGSGILLEDNNE